jgi:hypothetical protein
MPTSEDLWAKELNVRDVSEASHAIRKGSQWVCLIRLIVSGGCSGPEPVEEVAGNLKGKREQKGLFAWLSQWRK